MRRIAALACLLAATTFLPVQAEAARFRGGSIKTSRTVIAVPGTAATSRAPAAETGKPGRAPFPTASSSRDEPVLLRLSVDERRQQPWCRSAVTVGGFCIMN